VTRWLWTDPAGTVTDLSAWGAGWHVTDELSAVLAPSYEFATQAAAGIDGEDLQQITATAGAPVLPLDLVADSVADLRARLRALAHTLRPQAGIGTLTAQDEGGAVRSLRCYYRRGIESARYRGNRARATLEFWSPSPWWRGAPYSIDFGLAAPTPFFPIFPVRLSASTIQGQRTVDLTDCDADTYPLTLTNSYPGTDDDGQPTTVTRQFVLASTIGDGQTVTIDTRPGRQRITRSDGVNLMPAVQGDPALWPLRPAVNTVTAFLTNALSPSRILGVADRVYSGAV
jgi:hypothetical protein